MLADRRRWFLSQDSRIPTPLRLQSFTRTHFKLPTYAYAFTYRRLIYNLCFASTIQSRLETILTLNIITGGILALSRHGRHRHRSDL